MEKLLLSLTIWSSITFWGGLLHFMVRDSGVIASLEVLDYTDFDHVHQSLQNELSVRVLYIGTLMLSHDGLNMALQRNYITSSQVILPHKRFHRNQKSRVCFKPGIRWSINITLAPYS
jgi:hypothetical protein